MRRKNKIIAGSVLHGRTAGVTGVPVLSWKSQGQDHRRSKASRKFSRRWLLTMGSARNQKLGGKGERGKSQDNNLCVWGGQMSTLSVVVCIDKMQRGLGAGLAKMTFNKSHLGISMVTRGHFITVKFFLWGHRQGHGKGQLPPSGTTHATYDWQIRRFWSSG